jgi:hypothetical protein
MKTNSISQLLLLYMLVIFSYSLDKQIKNAKGDSFGPMREGGCLLEAGQEERCSF